MDIESGKQIMKRASDEVICDTIIDTRSFSTRTDESESKELAQILGGGRRGKTDQLSNFTGSLFGETMWCKYDYYMSHDHFWW
ncbi:hypothetical protein KSF_075620 [Reticulibacter mediterranei]|uniref:Uncharacterized protein n=1 Tax=Reticulibacter mediterranei TaxID=2778369 RepID=A0A8J3IL09_9CHLR|nr:hypothetical protein KSF_075620 [Reticulibacter mediterranei]